MASAVPQKQFTGRHMLASIVAFFAVIIGVVFLKERPGRVRLAAVALAAAGIALLKLGA